MRRMAFWSARVGLLLAAGVYLGSVSTASAAVIYDESGDGDASNSAAAPTLIALALGDNEIIGTTGSGDRDHFTFTIGASEAVTSFIITEFNGPEGGGGHFFGFANGSTVPSAGSSFLISDLIANAEAPFNVLGASGGAFGGTGVPTELGPGDYSVLFNETAGGSVSYRASITVSAIPEPSSGFAALFVSAAWMVRRRRKTS
ncbi:MAG: PEP-CTERM sorting domain-containing protein [Planctomycetota bacterium]